MSISLRAVASRVLPCTTRTTDVKFVQIQNTELQRELCGAYLTIKRDLYLKNKVPYIGHGGYTRGGELSSPNGNLHATYKKIVLHEIHRFLRGLDISKEHIKKLLT